MTLEFADPALSGGTAFGQRDRFFGAHYLTILRLCIRQLGDVSDAEDATQETFRRAVQHSDDVVGDPLPWLIAVARNVCIDELRRRRSGRTILERSAAQGAAGEADSTAEANPEHHVIGRMVVGEFMGTLTPAERRVVTKRLVEGATGGDLAASVGVTASTTRVLLARAREKLRRYLEEGSSVLGGAGMAGWYGLRQRVLGRPWLAQPRVALLLPPLMAGVMFGGAGAPAAVALGGAGTQRIELTTAPRIDMAANSDERVTAAGQTVHAVPEVAAVAPGPQRPVAPAPAASGALGLLPAPDPNQVWVTDFEPSPNYSSDHTVYMVGGGNCYAPCDQMFRSTDGGATWTYTPSQNLQSNTLVLPPATFGSGRFFAAGGNLLQVTNDDGKDFSAYWPTTGFAAAAPPWLDTQMVAADMGLSFIDSAKAPHLITLFAPGKDAAAAPLLLPGVGGVGFTDLQMVQDYVMGGPDSLLRCTAQGCSVMSQVPLVGNAQLLQSPDFASDHTLIAIGGGVAVSRDGGASFQLVSSEPVGDAVLVRHGSGERLIAVDAARMQVSDLGVSYSDDLGRTWHTAGFDQSLNGALFGHSPRVLAPGRLIASAADPRHAGMHVFVCSTDGALWSSCLADGR